MVEPNIASLALTISVQVRGDDVLLGLEDDWSDEETGTSLPLPWVLDRAGRLYRSLEAPGITATVRTKLIQDLSDRFVKPFEPWIEVCTEVIFELDRRLLKLPLDILSHRSRPLFLQKPVAYRLGGRPPVSAKPVIFDGDWSALIFSDRETDPDRACEAVASGLLKTTCHDASGVTRGFLRGQKQASLLLLSAHGLVTELGDDHLKIGQDKAFPDDFRTIKPVVAYFDSCQLGVSTAFLTCFQDMGTQYYLGPVLSNEAGESSTTTMLRFFAALAAGRRPETALYETRQELYDLYGGEPFRRRAWRAFPFRLYQLN